MRDERRKKERSKHVCQLTCAELVIEAIVEETEFWLYCTFVHCSHQYPSTHTIHTVHRYIHIIYRYMYVRVLMRDEKEGRRKEEGSRKQARSNKQQGKATQHTQGSHFKLCVCLCLCIECRGNFS